MRIAIGLKDGKVARHMGHCPQFFIADVEGKTVVETTEVENPRTGPGGPPPFFLAGLGVNHLIGGAAPDRFFGVLDMLGIQYTRGVKDGGDVREVLDAFLAGTLVATESGTITEFESPE